MRIALLSMKGNFNKDLGQGVQKYIYNIWQNMLSVGSANQIDKVELGWGSGLRARQYSFTMLSMLNDLSKYDIVHMPAPILLNPVRRGRAKTITTSHEFFLLNDDNPLRSTPEGNPPFIGEKLYEMCRRQMLGSDYMIADSTLILNEAVKLGYSKDRIFLINIGIDQEFIDVPFLEHSRGDTFVVGRLGSFGYRKNVAFSLGAFMRLKDTDMRFEVWGRPGGNYNELATMAANDKRVVFKGFAPKEQLVNIYDSFDVYLHPILYTGFEMEILEAQARGVPVIVQRKGQIPEEVRRYCFEADDEDEMAEIIKDLKDNGYDRHKRDESMAYARQFTWRRTAEQTIKAYERVGAN
ncbi:MAG: glycosyltransferase [Candidatus Micrarchaeota archaeon]|nr:glycosyltransferase [Candidatus Micrarchaeota archaeon]